jgi:HD-GYP domain-containing protein (c-di-GMP phosphodiesterase class II)
MELLAAVGKGQAFFEAQNGLLQELIGTALRENRTVTLQNEAGNGSIMVAPFPRKNERGGAIIVVREGNRDAFRGSEIDTLSMLSAITSVSWRNADLQDAQRNFFTYVTELVVMAVDSHVSCRDGHSKKVAEFSNRVGRELNFSEEQLHVLHFSALLHDIGMLKLSRAQHTSPKHYKQHPMIASKMLVRIRLWGDMAPIVLHHHERFDGTGYPSGLAGQEIPMESRVLCLADSVDAMSRDDDRRTGISLEEICEELRECSGTQFDPVVVQAFLRTVERGEISLAS